MTPDVFLIMTPDVFHIMTPYRLRHYDAFRSPLLVTCFPKIVIQNGGKNALWESRETGQWNGVKNLLCWWRLTDSLITVADPSHSFRMTLNVSLIMTPFPPIVILNGGKNALWERRETTTWQRVKNLLPGWRLTFPSLQQQILCCCFVWHLTEIICFGF